jgi:hypothetical protein
VKKRGEEEGWKRELKRGCELRCWGGGAVRGKQRHYCSKIRSKEEEKEGEYA